MTLNNALNNIPQDVALAIDAANATDMKALDLAATISAYFYDPITYGKEQKKWNTHSGGQYAVISGLLNSQPRGHHMNNRHLLDAAISGIALVVFVVGTIAVLYGAGFAG